MINMPKLSIITVNLNNKEGLQRTVDSVISQTFSDFEWIIIDGGSNDGSTKIIEKQKKNLSYWCSEPDGGIYNAMNKGVAHAKGEWVQFLNSGDCLYDKQTLEKIFSFDYPKGILYADASCYEKGKLVFNTKIENKMSLHFLIKKGICHQSSFIYKDLLSIRPYNEQYKIAADWDFFIYQLINGTNFIYIRGIVSKYELGGTSNTHIDDLEKEREKILSSLLPQCVIDDINYLNDMTEGQLNEIKVLRDQGPLYKRLISLNVKIMRILSAIMH